MNAINLPHRPTFTLDEKLAHRKPDQCRQIERAGMCFWSRTTSIGETPIDSPTKTLGGPWLGSCRLRSVHGESLGGPVLGRSEKDSLRVRN